MDDKSFERIIALLHSSGDPYRDSRNDHYGAIYSLCDCGDPRAFPILVQVLKGPDNFRQAAMIGIGRSKIAALIPNLLAASRDSDLNVILFT